MYFCQIFASSQKSSKAVSNNSTAEKKNVKGLLQIKSGLGTVGPDVSPNKISVCCNSCACMNVCLRPAS